MMAGGGTCTENLLSLSMLIHLPWNFVTQASFIRWEISLNRCSNKILTQDWSVYLVSTVNFTVLKYVLSRLLTRFYSAIKL